MKGLFAGILIILIFLCSSIPAEAARGYIYDAASGNRIVNAVVVCETFNTSTQKWELWNANERDQNNPMMSDRNGNYGWIIPAGKYRIKVTSAGYNEYISEELNVPPSHTGVNIGLLQQEIIPTPTPVPTPAATPKQPYNSRSGGTAANPLVTPEATPSATPELHDEPAKKFNDLTGFKWAENQILHLASIGIIKGISDTEFAPANNICRGDFVILLIRLFNLSADTSENFDDVHPNDYYYKEIAIAKSLGLVQGKGNNLFEPKSYVTRQELFTLTYHAMLAANVKFEFADKTAISSFNDYEDIADYAKDAFNVLVQNDLIKGNLNHLLPNSFATRAEAAVFIYRASEIMLKTNIL